jgi:hypothetical protein
MVVNCPIVSSPKYVDVGLEIDRYRPTIRSVGISFAGPKLIELPVDRLLLRSPIIRTWSIYVITNTMAKLSATQNVATSMASDE